MLGYMTNYTFTRVYTIIAVKTAYTKKFNTKTFEKIFEL